MLKVSSYIIMTDSNDDVTTAARLLEGFIAEHTYICKQLDILGCTVTFDGGALDEEDVDYCWQLYIPMTKESLARLHDFQEVLFLLKSDRVAIRLGVDWLCAEDVLANLGFEHWCDDDDDHGYWWPTDCPMQPHEYDNV